MIKKLTLLLFCITNISYGQNKIADYNLDSKIPLDSTAIRGSLNNGLKYYIKKNDRPKKTVEFRLFINVGSLQEEDDQLGVAHFLEHMLFNGTKNFPKHELIKYLESIGVKFGADLNAHTGFDETVYKLSVPSEDIEKVNMAFRILEDWAHNALLEDSEIELERGVVLEEQRLRNKGIRERMFNKFKKIAYQGTREIERLPIGTVESIKNFSPQRLRDFYNTWYRPNLMSIIIAGDIDESYAKQKIETHFSSLVNPKNPKPLVSYGIAPSHKEKKVKVLTDPELTNNVVSLLFLDKEPTPVDGATVKDAYTNLKNSLLHQMINNRLRELSFSKNAPFIGGSIRRTGSLITNQKSYLGSVSFEENKATQAIKSLYQELERAKRFGFTDTELENAKKNILSANEKAFKTRNERYSKQFARNLIAEFKGTWALNSVDWHYNFKKEIVPEISSADIQNLLKKYYQSENQKVIIQIPKKEGINIPKTDEILDVITKVEKDESISAYESKKLDSKLIKELRPAGKITNSEPQGYEITKLKLSNGANVYYKKTDFDSESIRFKSFSHGGTSLLDDSEVKTIGIAQGFIPYTGISGFKNHELPKVLAGKRVRVNSAIGPYDQSLTGSSQIEDMETLFQLIYANFTARNTDKEAFDLVLSKVEQSIKNQSLNPKTAFRNAIRNEINKNNPRYVNIYENNNFKKVIQSVSYDKTLEFYKKRFSNAGEFNFFFIGNFEQELFEDYVKKYIASLPGDVNQETAKIHIPPKNDFEEKEIITYRGIEEKAELVLEYRFETPYKDKEAKAMNVFKTILERKLRNKIREENGGTYTVKVSFYHQPRPINQYLGTISFGCDPKNLEKLQKETLTTIKELLESGPTDEDVKSVKEQWVLDRKKASRENGHWLNKMRNTVYWKKPIAKMYDGDKTVKKINAKYIKKISNKVVGKPYIIAKLLPEKK